MTWDTSRPRNADQVSAWPDQLASDMTEIDHTLRTVVYWGDGAANAGGLKHPRVTSTTATEIGTARMFVVPRSEVSYRKEGDFFWVSDESRWDVAVGGAVVTVNSDRGITSFSDHGEDSSYLTNGLLQGSRVLIQSGIQSVGVGAGSIAGADTITFGQAYSSPPVIMASLVVNGGIADPCNWFMNYDVVNTNGQDFKTFITWVGTGAANTTTDADIHWVSIGTVAV